MSARLLFCQGDKEMMMTETSIPQWGRFEVALTSATAYANPLQEAELRVTFESPTGQTHTIYGFWDGDTTWRIRFMPAQPGRWRYSTHCSDTDNSGLHGQSGTFLCIEPDGLTRFQQHGPLRLSANRRYLEHADGTPFFWLADTAWNGPLRATSEEWAHYLRQRTRQNFTAVQWVATQWISAPHGDRSGQLPVTGQERIAHPKTGTPLPWPQALTMPAAEQMAPLADLFESIEWWRLQPASNLVKNQPDRVAEFIAAAQSEEGDLGLVYTPVSRQIILQPDAMSGSGRAEWINPRNGQRQSAQSDTSEDGWTFKTPAPGDWLLLLTV